MVKKSIILYFIVCTLAFLLHSTVVYAADNVPVGSVQYADEEDDEAEPVEADALSGEATDTSVAANTAPVVSEEETKMTGDGDLLAGSVLKLPVSEAFPSESETVCDLLAGIGYNANEIAEEINIVVAPATPSEEVSNDSNDTAKGGNIIKGSLAALLTEEKRSFDEEDFVIAESSTDINEAYEDAYSKVKWSTNYSKSDLRLMACIIYCEAMDMGHDAQVAVGNVVINRMNSDHWAHCTTIKEVIYDKKWGVQFTPTSGNPSAMSIALTIYDSMDPSVCQDWQIRNMKKATESAKDVLRGCKTVPDSYEYFNGHIESSIKKCQEAGWSFMVIDRHIYYGHDTLESLTATD